MGRWTNQGAFRLLMALVADASWPCSPSQAAPAPATAHFRSSIKPILTEYCWDCHADGMKKGGVAYDGFESDEALVANRDLWFAVLKNVRAGLMPPARKPRPSNEERKKLENWIKFDCFGIDAKNPDPGRVTVRRLNRVEYRNTIRDLIGIEFKTENEFPPDDTGYGFDNIGDVLTISPMLLEKYLGAARTIVAEAVPAARPESNEPQSAAASASGEGKEASRWKTYRRFFPKDPPLDLAQRRGYAAELLGQFASRAFRRPAGEATAQRLADLAEKVYNQPGAAFEAGIAQAMVAILASPRFLFREEQTEAPGHGRSFPLIDEYSLASRLSYFLWSSMPDEELSGLAARGQLRKNQAAQVKRMLADSRSSALVRNFTGQWLQARDVETIDIDAPNILRRESKPDPERERQRARLKELRAKQSEDLTPDEKEELAKAIAAFQKRQAAAKAEFTGELRRDMRRETEKVFDYVVHEDRPVVELIDSDYTFLNGRLAKHYGIEDVTGDEMRLVKLPPDSPRGGILGEGTVLVVTSHPTRTSPVKRGKFILDNILGMPPPPPPPNVPPLEDAAKGAKDHELTLRETLELHRKEPLCHSCHNRMDPLGLAMDNFNALGMWREEERGQPIETGGKLLTGESFDSVHELKHLLATNHRQDFYRCLTEKLLTYATGRGLDYHDVETVDEIVQRLEREGGRFSALLMGVIESSPFQKRRTSVIVAQAGQ